LASLRLYLRIDTKLLHKHYSSDVHADDKTVDEDLVKANFSFAGVKCGEVWSGIAVKGHPAVSEYIDPGGFKGYDIITR